MDLQVLEKGVAEHLLPFPQAPRELDQLVLHQTPVLGLLGLLLDDAHELEEPLEDEAHHELETHQVADLGQPLH